MKGSHWVCSEKIHVVSSAFSGEETMSDQVHLTLYRCSEDAIPARELGLLLHSVASL